MSLWKMFVVTLYTPTRSSWFIRSSLSRAAGYVVLLMLLCLLPTLIIFSAIVSTTLDSARSLLNSPELPDFTLSEGAIQSLRVAPVLYEQNGLMLLFDASGSVTPSELEKYDKAVAMLQTQLVLKDKSGMHVLSYQPLSFLNTDKAELLFWSEGLVRYKWLLISLLAIAFLTIRWLLKIAEVLLLALLGWLLCKWMSRRLPFARLCVLACFLLTLPTVLTEAARAFSFDIPLFPLLCWLLGGYNLFRVLREIDDASFTASEQSQVSSAAPGPE